MNCYSGVSMGDRVKIDAEQSNIIRWMSFFAIGCVVLGHCRMGSDAVQVGIFDSLCQWHVPFFYFISGMFLYVSLTNHAWGDVVHKRCKTLVVPYFLWCLISLLFKGRTGLSCSVDEAFAFCAPSPVGNPHLWYLHCLIVFVIIAMLIWRTFGFLSYGVRRIVLGSVFAGLFVVFEYIGIKSLYGTPTSPFYFLSGFLVAPLIAGRKLIKFWGGGGYLSQYCQELRGFCWCLKESGKCSSE